MSRLTAALTAPATLRALTTWLPGRRWFDGAAHAPAAVSVLTTRMFAAPDGPGRPAGAFVVVRALDRAGGHSGDYVLTLGADEHDAQTHAPDTVVTRDGRVTVYDALDDQRLVDTLIRHIAGERDLDGVRYRAETPGFTAPGSLLPTRALGTEQSNSSVVAGERYILKVLRRMTPGPSPDLVLHRLLRDAGSAHVTPLLGAAEDRANGATYATLQEFLPKACDGWAVALAAADTPRPAGTGHPRTTGDHIAGTDGHPPPAGDFTADIVGLGRAVAAVHRDLAAAGGGSQLLRDDYARLSQRFLHRLERALAVSPRLAPYAGRLETAFTAVAGTAPAARRRAQLTHGDLHLGQTLRTAGGWLVLDFEGEPMAGRAERLRRHSPLRDVAGMLRSFDYAAHHRLTDRPVTAAERDRARSWATHHQAAFLTGYTMASGQDLREDLALLHAYELDKAVYEVLYDTQHRPAWAWIPLRAVQRRLTAPPG
ncbi:maltokinase N-terminal cap-like domain-containing protein [Streptomyces uncialis]|uniref:maltokinase N-terminal cap-like domain-containing protein n=1 Tax=Streptomyces uncialis TaxID=1048205 RepID=UPI00340F30AB